MIALILKDLLSDENLYFKFADKYSRIVEENTKKSLVKLSKKALATLTAYGLTDFLNTKLFSYIRKKVFIDTIFDTLKLLANSPGEIDGNLYEIIIGMTDPTFANTVCDFTPADGDIEDVKNEIINNIKLNHENRIFASIVGLAGKGQMGDTAKNSIANIKNLDLYGIKLGELAYTILFDPRGFDPNNIEDYVELPGLFNFFKKVITKKFDRTKQSVDDLKNQYNQVKSVWQREMGSGGPGGPVLEGNLIVEDPFFKWLQVSNFDDQQLNEIAKQYVGFKKIARGGGKGTDVGAPELEDDDTFEIPNDSACDESFVADLIAKIINDSPYLDPVKDKIANKIDGPITAAIARLGGYGRAIAMIYAGVGVAGGPTAGQVVTDKLFQKTLESVLGSITPSDISEPSRVLSILLGPERAIDICNMTSSDRDAALDKAEQEFQDVKGEGGIPIVMNIIKAGYLGDTAKNIVETAENFEIVGIDFGDMVFGSLFDTSSPLPESKINHWQKLAGIK